MARVGGVALACSLAMVSPQHYKQPSIFCQYARFPSHRPFYISSNLCSPFCINCFIILSLFISSMVTLAFVLGFMLLSTPLALFFNARSYHANNA
jgi:hypothetical protein